MYTVKEHFEYIQRNNLLLLQEKLQSRLREGGIIVLSLLYIFLVEHIFKILMKIHVSSIRYVTRILSYWFISSSSSNYWDSCIDSTSSLWFSWSLTFKKTKHLFILYFNFGVRAMNSFDNMILLEVKTFDFTDSTLVGTDSSRVIIKQLIYIRRSNQRKIV